MGSNSSKEKMLGVNPEMKSRKFNKRYGASLVCQKTQKQNILRVFLMSNFINI